jgi:hypothetical protein
MPRHRPLLELGQRLVDRDDRGAGDDPLGRDAVIFAPQPLDEGVFDRIERREVDMPALGRDDVVAALVAKHLRDAQPGAGPAHGDRTALGQRRLGPAQMQESPCIAQLRDGVANRREIVDHRPGLGAQPLRDQRRADDPRIVGELDHLAADRGGHRDRRGLGQGASQRLAESLPGELQARMLGDLLRYRLADRDDATLGYFGNREAGVGPSDIDRDDFHAFSLNLSCPAACQRWHTVRRPFSALGRKM